MKLGGELLKAEGTSVSLFEQGKTKKKQTHLCETDSFFVLYTRFRRTARGVVSRSTLRH